MRILLFLTFTIIINPAIAQDKGQIINLFANDELSDSTILDSAFQYYNLNNNSSLIDSLIESYGFNNDVNLHSIMGDNYFKISNYKKSLIFYKKALKAAESKSDTQAIVSHSNKLAQIYRRLGKFEKAINSLEKNIQLIKQSGLVEYLPFAILQFAYTYRDYGKPEKAATYFQKALKVSKENSLSEYLGGIYNELGNSYAKMGKFDKALEMHNKGLEIRKKRQPINSQELVSSYNDIGNTYQLMGKLKNALKMYKKAKVYAENTSFKYALAVILLNIGTIQVEFNKYNEALNSFNQAKKIADNMGYAELKLKLTLTISSIYRDRGNYKKALELHYAANEISDSIKTQKADRLLEELNAKYKSAEKDKEIIKQEARINRQRLLIIFSITALLIVGIFFVFVIRLLQQKRKAYSQLEIKNKETEEQKEEIEMQRNEITTQRDILAEQQNHITDSLNYAKHIQNALLPDQTKLEQILKNYFIFYKPLEIVSGDFYQIYQNAEKNYLVMADCTGHGVPGAFMSLLGISALKDIMASEKILSAREILEVLRKEIKQTLQQEKAKHGSRDGMDISILIINNKSLEAEFAGARHSLIKITKGQLEEIKGDKQPIGIYAKEKPFTQQNIQLQKDDMLYLYTDGFIDQFGGVKGKKFMKKRFLNLLRNINSMAPENQIQEITQTFENWKGNHDQIDDVSVMGIRI